MATRTEVSLGRRRCKSDWGLSARVNVRSLFPKTRLVSISLPHIQHFTLVITSKNNWKKGRSTKYIKRIVVVLSSIVVVLLVRVF